LRLRFYFINMIWLNIKDSVDEKNCLFHSSFSINDGIVSRELR